MTTTRFDDAIVSLKAAHDRMCSALDNLATVKIEKSMLEAQATLSANEGKDNADTRSAQAKVKLLESAEYRKALELESKYARERDVAELDMRIERYRAEFAIATSGK